MNVDFWWLLRASIMQFVEAEASFMMVLIISKFLPAANKVTMHVI